MSKLLESLLPSTSTTIVFDYDTTAVLTEVIDHMVLRDAAGAILVRLRYRRETQEAIGRGICDGRAAMIEMVLPSGRLLGMTGAPRTWPLVRAGYEVVLGLS